MALEPSMHLLDRIEAALDARRVDAEGFEEFAQDGLGVIYPGLAPIPKGTDWGRDADIAVAGRAPIRVAITTSGTLDGVRANMLRSIKSLQDHDQPAEQMVLANLATLTASQRARLEKSAAKRGVLVVGIYDRRFFRNELRRDGEWRKRLLGIPGDPIAVSWLPEDLARSAWAAVPLVGRETELNTIRAAAPADGIVVGAPGSGKSRLLAELDDVVFVDADATIGVVADDLRRLQPAVVVIDDAGDRLSTVRLLHRLRSQEPDLLSYRLLAVCWPDEVEHTRDALPDATVVELGLLARPEMDQIVQAMGITGRLARGQILSQAEGRPGWAVALGDVLVTRDVDDLVKGKALLVEVSRHLRRRGLGDAVSDLLGVIAALGELHDDELPALAMSIGMALTDVRDSIRAAAHSGLIDATQRTVAGGPSRSYRVRPPMLANALVAERLFNEDVPAGSATSLYDAWPAHRRAITSSTIGAAYLGSDPALTSARTLIRRAEGDAAVPEQVWWSLASRYGLLSRNTARDVIEIVRQRFDVLVANGNTTGSALEPCIEVAADLARWRVPEALRLVFDAAVADQRPDAPDGSFAARQLAELVGSFHPEMPADRQLPAFVTTTADAWLQDRIVDRPGPVWGVYGGAVSTALSPRRTAAVVDPGNPSSYQLHESVASDEEMVDAWPPVRDRLVDAPADVVARVLRTIEAWLHIGAGYDRPFGIPHPADVQHQAREVGERMLTDLQPAAAPHLGVAARFNRVAARYDVEVAVPIADGLAPFFADLDHQVDPQAVHTDLVASLSAIASEWVHQEPAAVCERLVALRTHLELAGSPWPSRIDIACRALAGQVEDTESWIRAALDQGLFPHASYLVDEHRRRGYKFTAAQVDEALSMPAARSAFARAVLTDEDAEDVEVDAVLAHLQPTDYRMLDWVMLDGIPADRVRQLLTETSPGVRAGVAAAMAHLQLARDPDGWLPEHHADAWLDALAHLADVPDLPHHELNSLYGHVAAYHPERYLELLQLEATQEPPLRLTVPMLDAAGRLSPEAKAEVLAALGDDLRSNVLPHMIDADIAWLAAAIETDLLTADDALSALYRSERRPPIEDIARLLAPRGIDPEAIAAIGHVGGWTSLRSDRYDRIVRTFEAILEADEPEVAAVGRAGVEMFLHAGDDARQEEQRQRVLGYR